VRAASAARTVERGWNPEDGTGEGLATLTLRGGISILSWREGAPDVVAFEGARTPGEAIPGLPDTGAAQAASVRGSAGSRDAVRL